MRKKLKRGDSMAGVEKSGSSTSGSSNRLKKSSSTKPVNQSKPAPKASSSQSKVVPKPTKDSAALSGEKPGKAPAGMVEGFKDSFARPAARAGQLDPRGDVNELGGVSISNAALLKGHLSGSPVDSAGVVKAMADNNALGKGGAQQFEPSQFAGVVPKDPGAPFSGSGATGKNVLDSSMPVGDMLSLNRHKQAETDLKGLRKERNSLEAARPPAGLSEDQKKRFEEMRDNRLEHINGNIKMSKGVQDALEPTYQSYQNPMSTSNDPKVNDPEKAWSPAQREQQAKLMLQQPINSLHKDAYGDNIPTRAEVIESAAKKYNLDPKVLGGVLLQEQRDQSRKEDAADIGGARLGGGNTSIGLGQVTMGTAMKNKNDLFADTVPDAKVRENLSRDEVARLLTSDEHNIFAAARYMRGSAERGQTLGSQPNGLDEIKRTYPGFDPNALSGSKWNADTIKAMAGDYSANSFNQNLPMNPGYPEFVNVAVEDIGRTGIFPTNE